MTRTFALQRLRQLPRASPRASWGGDVHHSSARSPGSTGLLLPRPGRHRHPAGEPVHRQGCPTPGSSWRTPAGRPPPKQAGHHRGRLPARRYHLHLPEPARRRHPRLLPGLEGEEDAPVRDTADRPRSRDAPLQPHAGPGRVPHRGRPVHRPACRTATLRRQTPRRTSPAELRHRPPNSRPEGEATTLANLNWTQKSQGVSRLNRGRPFVAGRSRYLVLWMQITDPVDAD